MRQPQPPLLRLATRPIVRERLGFRELPQPGGVLLVGLGEHGRLTLEVVEAGQDRAGGARRHAMVAYVTVLARERMDVGCWCW